MRSSVYLSFDSVIRALCDFNCQPVFVVFLVYVKRDLYLNLSHILFQIQNCSTFDSTERKSHAICQYKCGMSRNPTDKHMIQRVSDEIIIIPVSKVEFLTFLRKYHKPYMLYNQQRHTIRLKMSLSFKWFLIVIPKTICELFMANLEMFTVYASIR